MAKLEKDWRENNDDEEEENEDEEDCFLCDVVDDDVCGDS